MTKSSLRGYKKGDAYGREINEKAKEVLGYELDESKYESIDDIREMASKYENKSEDELMDDLKEMLDSGRKDGSFNDEMLDSFYKTASPMMDEEQRAKLDNLIDMIKHGEI